MISDQEAGRRIRTTEANRQRYEAEQMWVLYVLLLCLGGTFALIGVLWAIH